MADLINSSPNDAMPAVEPPVITAVENGVCTITMNRPANRNALSVEMVRGLADAFQKATELPEVHLVVLTGNGPTFCAGADLKERRTVTEGATNDSPPAFVSVFETIQRLPKVVVAKLNGSALAGGLGLACACDLVIAPASAIFGFTEVRIGVAPAIISVVCLPRMSVADSAELFLTGQRFSAERALAAGLVNRVVPDAEIDGETAQLVSMLRLGGPKALAATKDVLRRVPTIADRSAAFREMAVLSGSLFSSDEAAEGMAAFAQKRPPNWTL